MPFDSSSRILISCGTGSFDKVFIAETVRLYPHIQRLVVYSRDALKQWELQQLYPPVNFPQPRLFLGDVRDRLRSSAHATPRTPPGSGRHLLHAPQKPDAGPSWPQHRWQERDRRLAQPLYPSSGSSCQSLT